MNININDTDIFFNVQYSNRQTITMDISPEGHITVKAPRKTTSAELEQFMHSKSKQLLALYAKLNNRQYISSQKTYNEEENFLYMGRPCKLSELLDTIPEDEAAIPVLLKKFYTKHTKEIIKKRVKYYEGIIGVKCKSFTIVDSSGTWGTCNSLRELTFNYRLSMAPPASIDYVVIHELCHIYHMNHDRSFWRKVGSYDKNYEQHQAFFHRFGGVMTI